MIVFTSSIAPGFSHATPSDVAPVKVWFEASPELTILYPTFYEFNVAAKTHHHLSITDLHWDFGDGSALDSPYSTLSYVSEARYHEYAQPGTYTVTVTAYDTAGNSGSAQITVIWAL